MIRPCLPSALSCRTRTRGISSIRPQLACGLVATRPALGSASTSRTSSKSSRNSSTRSLSSLNGARSLHDPSSSSSSSSSLSTASFSSTSAASASAPSSTSTSRPLKIAIIGAGPSGFYTASRILQTLPAHSANGKDVEVHMYERLPTPYGLVRYGVAPDHPEVKNCQHKFDELASDPRFKYFGNVLLSSQPSSSPSTPSPPTSLSPYTYPHAIRLSFDDILPYYSTLVLTYGASLSNPLSSVSGSSSSKHPLKGVLPALALVSWYNSHPAFHDLPVDLSQIEDVSIIGQGNVALDVARILLKPVDSLAKTDLSDKVLDVLSKSSVKRVRVVGRRGPGQVAFTTKEFREMVSIPGVSYSGIDKGLMDQAKEIVGNERMRKRLLGLMEKPTATTRTEDGKTFELDFLKSPNAFLPRSEANNDGEKKGNEVESIGEVEWNVNQLLSTAPSTPTPTPPVSQIQSVPSSTAPGPATTSSSTPVGSGGASLIARAIGETVRLKADMVIESVGYRSEPLSGDGNDDSWELPFDRSRGRVRNIAGRVVDEEGVVVPGVYAAGWAARGPVGVIASTMHDAYSLSDLLLDDHFASSSASSSSSSSSSASSSDSSSSSSSARSSSPIITQTLGSGPGPMNNAPEPGFPEALVQSQRKGGILVGLKEWELIDRAERRRAEKKGSGKEREKFRTVEEMLAVLQ